MPQIQKRDLGPEIDSSFTEADRQQIDDIWDQIITQKEKEKKIKIIISGRSEMSEDYQGRRIVG